MGRKSNLEKLKEFKKNLRNEIPIDNMFLFGSRAKGKARKDSDFDILLVSERFRGKRFRYRGIGLRKHWSINSSVDFLCYTPKEFNKLKKEVSLVSKAIEEGIEIK